MLFMATAIEAPVPPGIREALRQSARTFRKWHGFDASSLVEVKGNQRIPRVLVALGMIPALVYKSDKWSGRMTTYEHKTREPRPLLCTGPDGKGLFIIGGRVKVTADGLID